MRSVAQPRIESEFDVRLRPRTRLKPLSILAVLAIVPTVLLPASCATGSARTTASPAQGGEPSPNRPTVVVIHSYSRSFAWTGAIDDAVQETLGSSDQPPEVLTEFLDTKRHSLEVLEPTLVDLLRVKYEDVEPAAVIVSDNNAFDFVGRHRDIFSDAPIVFCGINNFEPAWAPAGSGITGVVEATDLARTIRLMRDLQPGLAELAVVTDEVATGKLHRQAVIDLFDAGDASVDGLVMKDLSGLTAEQLEAELAGLGSDSAVLHMSLYRDTAGRNFTAEDGISFVVDRSEQPVYVLWDFMVVDGVVGGHVTSGSEQGRVAAEMALEILDGTPVDDLAIRTRSPNETILAWPAFTAHDLDPSLVGGGARYLDRPPSFYDRYRTYVLIAVALFALLTVAVIVALLVIGHLRRSQHKLLSSQAKVNQQNQRLAEMNKDLSDFAYSASHDLKSPVVNALGLIELAALQIDRSENDKARELLNRAVTSCERIVNRVEALLRFAVGGTGSVGPELVDFPALVDEAWEAACSPSSVVLITNHEDNGRIIAVKPVLEMVLENLITNAIKHRDPTVAQGTVVVRSRRENDRFVFEVEDDGVGIPQSKHADVGRPFHRFGQRSIEGTGLGLMLVKHYLARIDGRLTFTSEPGRGTTFVVDLPAEAVVVVGDEPDTLQLDSAGTGPGSAGSISLGVVLRPSEQ